jgi:hypothetical protein
MIHKNAVNFISKIHGVFCFQSLPNLAVLAGSWLISALSWLIMRLVHGWIFHAIHELGQRCFLGVGQRRIQLVG